ncbi:hypothetical protein BHE74_00059520 [Ensete ventricosum]|nr:hypothetical protein GW17_00017657 [Ensete ventricosum]RWW35536.1 hypothetical protein BHE74_00059520 [Ensete ventricosum]RZS23769.1 hypothetical protein BHM03_00056766 [Ensete ventricosum]
MMLPVFISTTHTAVIAVTLSVVELKDLAAFHNKIPWTSSGYKMSPHATLVARLSHEFRFPAHIRAVQRKGQ